MKNPSRADAPEGFADLSIFFPDTILRAEHLHAYADRADWRCAHTSARRTTAVGGVRADMSLSTYDVTISCDTHSISPRENQSARVYRGPCRARHRFHAAPAARVTASRPARELCRSGSIPSRRARTSTPKAPRAFIGLSCTRSVQGNRANEEDSTVVSCLGLRLDARRFSSNRANSHSDNRHPLTDADG